MTSREAAIFRIVHYRDGHIVARCLLNKRLAKTRDLAVLQMETHTSDHVEVRDDAARLVFEYTFAPL